MSPGAAKGLGEGIARAFAREGAAVTVADIDVAAGRETARRLRREEKAPAFFTRTDVSSAKQVDAMVARTVNRFGSVDVLVNNAGIVRLIPLTDIAESDWDRTINVNLKGPFLCSQAVARYWIREGKAGAIVNITTVGAEKARPDNAPYHASKGGLHSLTQALAMDLAPYGIRVNAIGPTAVASHAMGPPGTSVQREELVRSVVDSIPLGRMATGEEVGRVVCFLASEEAGYITGQHFYVDGGRTVAL